MSELNKNNLFSERESVVNMRIISLETVSDRVQHEEPDDLKILETLAYSTLACVNQTLR